MQQLHERDLVIKTQIILIFGKKNKIGRDYLQGLNDVLIRGSIIRVALFFP